MVKKIVLFIYFTFLCALALFSIFLAWFNQSLLIFVIEVAIDLILICGVVLYSRKVYFKPWILIFAISLFLQIFILTKAPYMDLSDFIVWLLILAPAVYMNIVASGLFHNDTVNE